MIVNRRIILGTVLALGLSSASPALANTGFGLHLGLTDDPDSFFVGGRFEVPITSSGSGYFAVDPSFDFGIGDEGSFDYFTIRVSANFKYMIPVGGANYAYPLFGPSVYYINLDDCSGDCDDTNIGINVGGGFQFDRFAFELWLGIEDVPEITFAFLFWL